MRLTSLGLILLVTACVARPRLPENAIALPRDVFVQPIGPNIWRHVSFRFFAGAGAFPSNGLIVRLEGGGALLVDTAWTPEETAQILDWTETNVGRVSTLLITHAHDDRIGGISETARRGIRSIALEATVEDARIAGWPAVDEAVESGFRLDAIGVRGELFFPGRGHTRDNAVVYLDETGVLAGTCLVRSLAARSMGNTSEADLASWPSSIRTLQRRYPKLKLVVPGHGEPGDRELLGHTLELLEAHRK